MRAITLLVLPWLASCATLDHEEPAPPAWDLDAADSLPASEAFQEAAETEGVPAELLAAIAWVETGFSAPSDEAGWFGFDAEQQAAVSSMLGVAHAELRERPTNLRGGAALLATLRDEHAPDATDTLDARWWPAVFAWSGSGLHAAEVFSVLQSGLVAWTDEAVAPVDLPLDSELDEPVVVLAPQALALPDMVVDLPLSPAPGYPGAIGALLQPAAPRSGPAHRLVLRATGRSFAASLAADAHYAINRRDGAVIQLRSEDEGGEAIVLALAAPNTSFAAWTAPLLEGAALLAVDVAQRHGLDPMSDVDTSELGESFPEDGWRQLLACVGAGGSSCGGVVGLPVDVPLPAVAPGDEDRDSAVPSVPYFYQYANALNPGASCQNTSIAMVLGSLGWTGTPDQITARFGKDLAQSPAGLAQVFNTLATEAGLSARLTPNTSGSIEGLRALLDAGKPTIVHGYMTGYGHVLVALKYTGSNYVVNDPAGRWAQSFKGGYPYGWSTTVGKGISYGRAAFEQAVATSDGSSHLPLWYHELTGVDAADLPASEPEEPPTEPEGPPVEPGEGDTSSTAGVAIEVLEPRHGTTVPDPLVLSTRRSGGDVTSVTSDGWTLLPPTSATTTNNTIDLWTLGERNITARALSEFGTVLASHTVTVWVEEGEPAGPTDPDCAIQGSISCGQAVSGDTSSAEASDVLDVYNDSVGIWDAPELAWTFTGSGPVTVGFVDPHPSELNLDIMVLETSQGTCDGEALLAIAWNWLEFEAQPGKTYVFVVDGYDGAAGAFEVYVDCG